MRRFVVTWGPLSPRPPCWPARRHPRGGRGRALRPARSGVRPYVAAGVGQPILGFVEEQAEHGCAPDLLPIDEAQRVTTLYVVSFLTRELQGNSRYGPTSRPAMPTATTCRWSCS